MPLYKDISVSMEKYQTMPSCYNKDKNKKKRKNTISEKWILNLWV